MAVNANKPSGLSPVKLLSGADWDGRGNMYCVLAAQTNAIYIGDMVALVTGGDTVGFLQCVDRAGANGPAVGVVAAIGTNRNGGPYINPVDLTKVFRPSGAQAVNYFALVVDDPQVIFEIQEGSSGSYTVPLTQTSASKNAQWFWAAPNATNAVSGAVLDSANVNATASTVLKMLGLKVAVDNGVGLLNQRWYSMINNHQYSHGTGAAGV